MIQRFFEFIKEMLSGRGAASSKRFNGTFVIMSATICSCILLFMADPGTQIAILGILMGTGLTLFGFTSYDKKKTGENPT